MNTLLFQSISAIAAVIVFVALVRPTTFKFLLDKDSFYPSLGRQGQFVAMVSSTWLLVNDGLSPTGSKEWMFVGYMFAWAGAQFASIWLKLKGQGGGEPAKPTT